MTASKASEPTIWPTDGLRAGIPCGQPGPKGVSCAPGWVCRTCYIRGAAADLLESYRSDLQKAEARAAEAERERDAMKARAEAAEEDWQAIDRTLKEAKTIQGAQFLRAEAAELDAGRLREEKDGAYLERNQVVAALSKCFPACVTKTAIEGWSEDWHGCVYIFLPTGQVSWHFHDSHAHLFEHLDRYDGQAWDGHDTPEKYRRLAALRRNAP